MHGVSLACMCMRHSIVLAYQTSVMWEYQISVICMIFLKCPDGMLLLGVLGALCDAVTRCCGLGVCSNVSVLHSSNTNGCIIYMMVEVSRLVASGRVCWLEAIMATGFCGTSYLLHMIPHASYCSHSMVHSHTRVMAHHGTAQYFTCACKCAACFMLPMHFLYTTRACMHVAKFNLNFK